MRRLVWHALAGAAAVAVAGCGGGGRSERDRVESFINQVNAVQQAQAPEFERANRAFLAFSKGHLPPRAATRELAAAETAMRSARDQVSALHPPADARKLQRRLVTLFDSDAALAHESTLLAGFVPASVAALKPLPAIGHALSRDLKGAKGPAPQEAALRRYASGIRRVIRRLQPLHPPPILISRHSQEIEHLQRVRMLALDLAGALQARNSRRVAGLLLNFRRVSATGISTALTPTVLGAYNRRYLGVRRALQAVERERTRLDRTLHG